MRLVHARAHVQVVDVDLNVSSTGSSDARLRRQRHGRAGNEGWRRGAGDPV